MSLSSCEKSKFQNLHVALFLKHGVYKAQMTDYFTDHQTSLTFPVGCTWACAKLSINFSSIYT